MEVGPRSLTSTPPKTCTLLKWCQEGNQLPLCWPAWGLSEGGTVGVCVGGKPLQHKNGFQGPQPGSQKLAKRRYSMNVSVRPAGPAKRRRRASDSQPVLPSHFLLGGNIFDPLNLNSLLDEDVSRTQNVHTPETSPLPAKGREPLEILVPKDITDPLNLSGRRSGGGDGVLLSPLKRRRHRNRHHGAGPPEQAESEKVKPTGGVPEVVLKAGAVTEEPIGGAVLPGKNQARVSPLPYELNTSINCRDEVVQPILPRRHSQSGPGSGSQVRPPGSTDPALSGQPSSRSRKRRRTVSRSERLSITPTPTIGPSADRRTSQTFQTPIVGGAKGSHHTSSSQPSQKPRKPLRKYQYGNYSRFYGYHRPGLIEDPRLAVLKPEWFRRKKVLDLGCNTGHVTLAIARHWDPAHILGIDIDGGLVRIARQNLRHYLSEMQPTGAPYHSAQHKMANRPKQEVQQDSVAMEAGKKADHLDKDEKAVGGVFAALMDLQLTAAPSAVRRPFLLSFRLCRGPITAPLLPETSYMGFPHNVFFMKENYVLESEEQLAGQQEEYDVILCLGLTLWVQLNWGDRGLQRLFRRAHRQLRTGGLFILEPQPWSSYCRRKRISETTYRNYCSIRLKPDQFTSYLTSEVGFSSYELLGTPNISARGFQRPIYLFHKGPSSSRK
ncbi:7SK snRNA methylphosphate capping enzyme [Clupea harengus]|uniref:RNA methyltransferase n=1 Tax=Clupea harengus TaxID=7950 RepID=A0A6P3VJS4_CLUHA|nr:7SK snRNA methylphosphate capping enzyme [Clupea harengus]